MKTEELVITHELKKLGCTNQMEEKYSILTLLMLCLIIKAKVMERV